MGVLKGALSVRRYQVEGVLPEGRETLIEALNANSFREPLSPVHKEEILGWTQIHNLLDTSFDDVNLWLYNHYAVFALRMDKKTLPARLFKAHLQKRQEAWCKESGRERVPAKVKEELKELLELEMLRQTLPKVAVHEIGWNLAEGWLMFHNQSDLVNDKLRKLFHRTFGLVLRPMGPLDWVADRPEEAERLLAAGTSELEGA
jgi:DNA recombination-dependent growth factor C